MRIDFLLFFLISFLIEEYFRLRIKNKLSSKREAKLQLTKHETEIENLLKSKFGRGVIGIKDVEPALEIQLLHTIFSMLFLPTLVIFVILKLVKIWSL